MKYSISKIMVAISILLSYTISNAQIKNAITEEVKIYGNCGMCEKTIEEVGNNKKIAQVDWNKDTKMATLTYDAKKTNKEEILKRIALVGYDSDAFLAPTDVYENLPGCCQYEREAKTLVKDEMKKEVTSSVHKQMTSTEMQDANELNEVYENYFALKDALVKTDGESASKSAKELVSSIDSVKMDELKMDVHMVWMKVMIELRKDATAISASKDSKTQRASFDTLSESIYKLIKISKSETPVYFQHCPMANNGKGANWLSKENEVKNPYYGSKMLSCGKVVETIK